MQSFTNQIHMDILFTNTTGTHLAKTHLNKISKHAQSLAVKCSSAFDAKVSLNKSTEAAYDLNVSGNDIQVTVRSIKKLPK